MILAMLVIDRQRTVVGSKGGDDGRRVGGNFSQPEDVRDFYEAHADELETLVDDACWPLPPRSRRCGWRAR